MNNNPNRGSSRKEKKMNAITKAMSVAVLVALGLTQGAWAVDLPMRDSAVTSQTILLDGSDWRVAADPKNTGREEKWFELARQDAKPTSVPGVVQNVFTDFHGPAWYYASSMPPSIRTKTADTSCGLAPWTGLPRYGSTSNRT